MGHKNLLAVVVLLLLGQIALGASTHLFVQGGPGRDSNPYNPANWKDLTTLGSDKADGMSHGLGYDSEGYWYITDDPFTNVYVPQPEDITPEGIAHNSSTHDIECTINHVANVTVRKQWIGIGPPPQKVWVLKKASASLRIVPDGPGTVDNGLGSPTIDEYDAGVDNKTCSGEKLLEVSLNGDILEVQFSETAHGQGRGVAAQSYSSSIQSHISHTIELKAVKISTSFGGTFIKDSGSWARIPAPPGETHTIGRQLFENGNAAGMTGWGLQPTMYAGKIGDWTDPYHVWTDGENTWSDSLISEYDSVFTTYKFSLIDVENLPTSGPKVKNWSLSVSDVGNNRDHTAVPDVHALKIYAPLMHEAKVEDGTIYYKMVEDFHVNNPGYAVDGGSIGTTCKIATADWDVFKYVLDASLVISIVTGEEWLVPILHGASVVVEDFAPTPDSPIAPWAWDHTQYPGSTWEGYTWEGYKEHFGSYPGPSYENWQMVPTLKGKFQSTLFEAEKWDEHGYVGRDTSWRGLKIGYRWSGAFTHVGGGGGTIGGGSTGNGS